MLLRAITEEQAKPMKKTMEWVKQLLDYIASQEEAVLTYQASDMVLAIHSGASYLSKLLARSWARGIIFYRKMCNSYPIMGRSWICQPWSKQLCHQRRRLNLGPSIWMQRRQYQYKKHKRRWSTNSLQRWYRQTIQRQMEWSQIKCSPRQQRQWTWDSIGYGTGQHKSNSASTGDQVPVTWQTTGWNIIQLPIIVRWGQNFWRCGQG